MAGREEISPVVMVRRVGYLEEREESFEGVRARTWTGWEVERRRVRRARPVPPVAPKRVIVGRVVILVFGLDVCLLEVKGLAWGEVK